MSLPGPGLFVRCLVRMDVEIEGCESVDARETGFCGKLRSSGRGILYLLVGGLVGGLLYLPGA